MRQRISADEDSGRSSRVTVGSLLAELEDYEQIDIEPSAQSGTEGREQEEDRPQEVLTTVTNALFPGAGFRFDEDLIKQNLDETLLMLVSLREGGIHGKGLMDDLARLFNARLSPGTVYPQLHELENGGLLQMHEKVRTKEYNISDDRGVRTRLERSMYQHLAFGYAIYLALEDD